MLKKILLCTALIYSSLEIVLAAAAAPMQINGGAAYDVHDAVGIDLVKEFCALLDGPPLLNPAVDFLEITRFYKQISEDVIGECNLLGLDFYQRVPNYQPNPQSHKIENRSLSDAEKVTEWRKRMREVVGYDNYKLSNYANLFLKIWHFVQAKGNVDDCREFLTMGIGDSADAYTQDTQDARSSVHQPTTSCATGSIERAIMALQRVPTYFNALTEGQRNLLLLVNAKTQFLKVGGAGQYIQDENTTAHYINDFTAVRDWQTYTEQLVLGICKAILGREASEREPLLVRRLFQSIGGLLTKKLNETIEALALGDEEEVQDDYIKVVTDQLAQGFVTGSYFRPAPSRLTFDFIARQALGTEFQVNNRRLRIPDDSGAELDLVRQNIVDDRALEFERQEYNVLFFTHVVLGDSRLRIINLDHPVEHPDLVRVQAVQVVRHVVRPQVEDFVPFTISMLLYSMDNPEYDGIDKCLDLVMQSGYSIHAIGGMEFSCEGRNPMGEIVYTNQLLFDREGYPMRVTYMQGRVRAPQAAAVAHPVAAVALVPMAAVPPHQGLRSQIYFLACWAADSILFNDRPFEYYKAQALDLSSRYATGELGLVLDFASPNWDIDLPQPNPNPVPGFLPDGDVRIQRQFDFLKYWITKENLHDGVTPDSVFGADVEERSVEYRDGVRNINQFD